MTERGKSVEQRRQVWNACQTVLGCAGVIALGALAFFALGLLPRAAVSGRDVIVFIDYKPVRNSIFWCGLVGGIFFFLSLAITKSTRGLIIVCAIFTAAAGIFISGLYSRAAAIAFHDNVVELRYLWPKPAVRLNPQEIISVRYEESVCLSDRSLLEYALDLRTRERQYMSFGAGNVDDVQRTIRRIEGMQAKLRGP